MVIMILLSISFFYHAKGLMQTANQASAELTKGVIAVTTNVMEPAPQNLTAEEAGAAATNNLWQVMIHKPYLLLQFGSTKVEAERVDRLLRLEYRPYQESVRTALVKQEVDQGNLNMTAVNNGYRFLLLVFLSLFNVAMGVIMIFFALAMIGYQLYFLAILLIAPLVLTWAIVPAWQEIATRWIAEALRALMMKFAWGVLLAMLFAFSSALYDFTEDKSYVEMMVCQWALIAVLFWKRKLIFQLVTSPADYLAGGRWTDRNQDERDVQKIIGFVLRYTMGGKIMQSVVGKVLSNGAKK